MNLEHLRWWHWMLIGVCVGAVIAASRDFYGPGYISSNPGTIQDPYFSNALVIPPADPKQPGFDKLKYPAFLENLVVHPPVPAKDSMAYVVDVKADDKTYEVEVKDDKATKHRDKAARGDSLVLPVMWKNVPLDQLPATVSSAARSLVPGQVIAAHYGPTKVEYVVTFWGFGQGLRYTPPADAPNSEPVLHYSPVADSFTASVPYKPQINYLRRDIYVPAWDATAKNPHSISKAWPTAAKYDNAKAPDVFPTVMAYLDALKVKYPTLPLSYKYAWWEERQWNYILWIGGCALLVGVIWPAILYLLVGAGFGRAPEPEYDLSRFKPEKKKAGQKKKTAADLAGVNALNDQLEAGLLASAKSSAPMAAAEPVAVNENPFSKSKSAPAEPAPAAEAPAAKPKAFGTEGGSYYPTEIHVSKKPAKKD